MNKIFPYFFILLAALMGSALIVSDPAYSSEISSGGVFYNISQAKGTEPKFLNVEIDPLKVVPGSVQKMRAVMMREQNIVSVKASIRTDNKITEVPLSLTGYENNNPVYTAEWTVEDTHDTDYRTTFTARDSEGKESSFTLGWSDPECPAGTCWFGSSCNTGAKAVTCSNSNVTIPNGITVIIDNGGSIKWTGGYSVLVDGTLAISNGGVLTRGNQWFYDYDGDHYRNASQGWRYQEGSPGDGWRRADLFALYGDDCCDTDGNAHPGQTSWYTGTTACGGYDYNCNGSADQRYTSYSYCSSVSWVGCGSSTESWYKGTCSSYPCYVSFIADCGASTFGLTAQSGCSTDWANCEWLFMIPVAQQCH